MVVGRHLLLLDYVAGNAVFRGVRAATVVDINYDEHTPAWNGSGGNGISIAGGEHDAPPSPRPITPPHLDLRARLHDAAQRKTLSKPTHIDVDWDPDEPPTRLWNSSSMSIPVPAPLPPPETWAPGFDESHLDHAESDSEYPRENDVDAHGYSDDAYAYEQPQVTEPAHEYGAPPQHERVYIAQPERAYAAPPRVAESTVPPLPPPPHLPTPRPSRRIATPPPHPTQPPPPRSMIATRVGVAPPPEPRSMMATRIGIAPPAEPPSMLPPAPVLPPPPILPPPPPRERVDLGPELLPELAHNPNYFPGLNESPLDADFDKPQRKLPLSLIGAGVAVAAISGIGIWLFSGPKTCDVVIETTPADAKVSIDGRAVLGTQSPYSQEKLPLGSHQLLVQKPGFTDDKQAFTLDEHDDKRLLSVKLAAVVAAPKTAPVAVSSVPPGAAIFVDGQPTAMVTPASITTLRYGYHTVQLRLDGHAEGEQAVKVPDENAVAINLVALQPPAPKTREERWAAYKAKREAAKQARLEAAEARAAKRAEAREARLAKRAEAREARSSGASDADDAAERRHELRAAKIAALYRQRKGLPPKEGDEELLASMGKSHAGPSSSSFGSHAAETEKPASTGKTGTLMLNTRPWSEVYVDGEHVGHTPVRGLPLRAGHHKIKLENPQMGMSKTISVSIAAGETLTKSETLGD
jgi:hypothetical protein